jgi:predicted short-subunit dehydrogenase-like oxidoreductase (DUF2520 family)
MQVTIIGTGNVATVFGRLLVQKGHSIAQVYGRHFSDAQALALALGARAVSDTADIQSQADLYLIAVSDDALPELASRLSLGDKLVLHTAGSVSKDVLRDASSSYGVLWPMKMIRKNMVEITPLTIVVDGNTEASLSAIEGIAGLFSPDIARADDALRLKMHMLAAVVSNFPNHLYRLAADYCSQEQIEFSAFYPIISETVQQVQKTHPANVQAGPAFRGDRDTLYRHEAILTQYPQLLQLYTAISNSIMRSQSGGIAENGSERTSE